MGTILTLWRTYSSKGKWILALIIIALVIGLGLYAKVLHTQLGLTQETNDALILELAESEQELVTVTTMVREGKLRASALSAEVSQHLHDAADKQRQLDLLHDKFDLLVQTKPAALASQMVNEYNKYVQKLACVTGGSGCDE